jgi:hypothetical protein
VTGSPRSISGPGGAFASAPFVSFWMETAGAGMRRLTIVQVTIELDGAVPLKPPFTALKFGRGVSVGWSGVRYVHVVAVGSLAKPVCAASFTETFESTDVAVDHWKLAKPSAPVVVVAVGPDAPAGSTQEVGVGDVWIVICHPRPGSRSCAFGSGSRSTTLRTFTDGAQSWNAASRSASWSFEKSGSL